MRRVVGRHLRRVFPTHIARRYVSVLNWRPFRRSLAMAAKKKTMSKSDFIRSLPATLSGSQVVAKAKEAGMKLSSTLVYAVRGRAKGNGKGNTSSKVSASTKTGTSKAAFVRGLPSSTPAKEVVAKARAAGMKLTESYVYNVRGA